MIKNLEQARIIQQRRVDAKKRGFAHAVRRWARKAGIDLKTSGIASYEVQTPELTVIEDVQE